MKHVNKFKEYKENLDLSDLENGMSGSKLYTRDEVIALLENLYEEVAYMYNDYGKNDFSKEAVEYVKTYMSDKRKHVNTFDDFLKESIFVTKDEVDELLDKISHSGINSLSDIDKNRLKLFSEKDKEIIKIIEEMGDITNEFKNLNKKMNQLSIVGKDTSVLMNSWMELNDKLRPLEQSFRKWGIQLGDERLSNLMNKVRPDAYTNVIE